MLNGPLILIIDIETTGFQSEGGKIVEVGLVELDLESGRKVVLFDQVVHEKPLTREEVERSWIVSNGYMTTEEIRTSPDLRYKLPEIQGIINRYPAGATAFNRPFDFNFLGSRGIKFVRPLPCPMVLSTNVCKISSPNGRPGYKWPKAEEAYRFFFPEANYTEIHRAADDALHEADIVKKLYDMGIFKLTD